MDHYIRFVNKTTLLVTVVDEIRTESRFSHQLKKALENMPECTLVQLKINSPGGDIFQAMTAYDVLRKHSARVEGEINGVAIGAATLLAMACDELSIHERSFIILCAPTITTAINGRNAEQTMKTLDLCEKEMLNIYQKKTGLRHSDLKPMMEEEIGLTAKRAKLLHFVDSIIPAANNSLDNA